ncbi:hypothetical protein H5410_011612 [Solanum commersonii]|uniref:Uncharacterized protein n=1 Tax=Solanum commersonii TaxID=4109 RepID=A0A9J6AQD7_SOLCO|nr:hypothetical protein H5410_011612 [Solanum commersonii]
MKETEEALVKVTNKASVKEIKEIPVLETKEASDTMTEQVLSSNRDVPGKSEEAARVQWWALKGTIKLVNFSKSYHGNMLRHD